MIYLDYNATTPVDGHAAEEMARVLREVPGNPSSAQHGSGQLASAELHQARESLGDLLGAAPQDIVFTSGASEAALLGIVGAALGAGSTRPDILVSATEHKAILSAADFAARLTGGRVVTLPVDRHGLVNADDFRRSLLTGTVSVAAIMMANNETGTLNPVDGFAAVAHDYDTLFLCDATQAVGKSLVDLTSGQIDIAIVSGHKFYGPKGAGALVAHRSIQKRLVPVFAGGGQERGLRGGTQATPSIVGMGAAARIAKQSLAADMANQSELAARLIRGLFEALPDVELIGSPDDRLGNTVNLRFAGVDAEAVMAAMPHIEVSSGSACQSAQPLPSHVLMAMGLTRRESEECIRFSLGRPTTSNEIDAAVDATVQAVQRVRAANRGQRIA